MAQVTFKIYKGDEFNKDGNKSTWTPAYKEGQIIFVKKLGKIYLDYDEERTCYTADATPSSGSGMHYLGIAKILPEGTDVTLIDNTHVTAKENDMVVVGTKEYLYRKGDDGLKWYEIGDESAPAWED